MRAGVVPIVYCKDRPDEKIIDAIGVAFKDMRAKMGINMKRAPSGGSQ